MFLEDFAKLGGSDGEAAALRIYAHVTQNQGELKYVVTRLTRGLQSSKLLTRTGSYCALSALLKLKQLQPMQLKEFMESILVTTKENTKGERRLVYIARILAYGALIRNVPLEKILADDQSLLKNILTELMELCQRRKSLLELVSPFIVQLIKDDSVNQDVFDTHLWPALQPLFVKSEVKVEEDVEEESTSELNGPVLHIALSCAMKGLKTDFEVLDDIDSIVTAFSASKAAGPVTSILMEYLKKTDQTEKFWDAFVPHIRPTHFDLLLSCVESAEKAKIPHDVFVRKEIFLPFLAVVKTKEDADQHKKAVAAMGLFLKWSNAEGEEMNKKMRKKVMHVIFGDSPNMLHEYQTLVKLFNPFLTKVCTSHDLKVLEGIVEKHLDAGVSVRMGVVYVQFLAKIAKSKQCSSELIMKIAQKLLHGALGMWTLQLKKEKVSDTSTKENKKEDLEMFQKLCSDGFQSILTSTFNAEFMEELYQNIVDSKDTLIKRDEHKKIIKKVTKLSPKVKDGNLRYILQAYAVRLVIEQNNVLDEANEALQEVITLCDSKSEEDSTSKIVKFLLNTSARETQPPFNYEGMFSRLVVEDKVSSDCVQIFAEAIDSEMNDVANLEDEDSEDDSDDNEDEKENEGDKGGLESDDQEDESAQLSQSFKVLSKDRKDSTEDDSDSSADVDMDDATEEDLNNMDAALAKVFATKKKVKEEENSKIRCLMRTLKMLESFLARKSKKCHVSVPLLLLIPLVHSLQSSLRAIKKGQDLTPRIVNVLKKLNGIRKFEDSDSVETGSLLTMAKDIAETIKHTKNKVISHLLGESLVTLIKCYLTKSCKTRGESEGFLCLFNSLLEVPKEKRTKRADLISKVVFSALATIPGWVEEKPKVSEKKRDTTSKSNDILLKNNQLLSMLQKELAGSTPEVVESKDKKKSKKVKTAESPEKMPTTIGGSKLRSEKVISNGHPESESPKDSKKKPKKRKTTELPEEKPVEVVGRVTRSKKTKMT